jgi:hypothetical protein
MIVMDLIAKEIDLINFILEQPETWEIFQHLLGDKVRNNNALKVKQIAS